MALISCINFKYFCSTSENIKNLSYKINEVDKHSSSPVKTIPSFKPGMFFVHGELEQLLKIKQDEKSNM